jgi:hypothetical protein
MGSMMYMMGDHDAAKFDKEQRKVARDIARRNGLPVTPSDATRTHGVLRSPWCSMCINWRVVGVLALIGGGIAIVRPALLFAAGPLLLVLVCPLSMVLAMRTMAHRNVSVLPATSNGVQHSIEDEPTFSK